MSLAKKVSIYSFGMLLPQFVGFLLLPIYSRVLTKSDFSTISLLETIIILFSFFSCLSIDRGVLRLLSEKDGNQYYATFYTIALLAPILWGAVITSFLFMFDLTFYGVGKEMLALVLMIGVIRSSIQIFVRIVQYEEKTRLYFNIALLRSILDFILILGFILYIYSDFRGVYIASLISVISVYTICAFFMRPEAKQWFYFPAFLQILKFALPVVPTLILSWINNMSGRFFLESQSTSAVADFSMAFKISYLIGIVSVAVQTSISRNVYQSLDSDNRSLVVSVFNKSIILISSFTILYTVAFFILGDFILGEGYSGLWPYVALLNLSMFATGGLGVTANLIYYYYKDNIYLLITYVINSVFLLFLFSLFKSEGVLGISVSLFLSSLFLSVVQFSYIKRKGLDISVVIYQFYLLLLAGAAVCYFAI
ncbi:hypothetical protein KCN56_03140 [Photobacterium galatheae]|uniref:lipopolysaccharide biosynthesis protein n=1 Tax=Photobacterium galatheae TaxID=1654360 RepID=UPI00202CDAA8|nr:hypothetical protein [Photobacterium galatheae]MCM0147566.1 hypothetical protein [Photobacterium galatheae]